LIDFGCFDGKLLDLFLKNKLAEKAIGFDIADRKLVNNKIIFYKDIKRIEYNFDLIIFSHSLIYEKKIFEVLKNLISMANENCLFFIQIPKYFEREVLFSLIDQYHFFNEKSLRFLFKSLDIILSKHKINPINNDQVYLGRLNKKSKYKKLTKNSPNKIKLKKLNDKIMKLESFFKIKDIENKELFIFGSTIVASYFYYYIDKKKFTGFIDENKIKVGSKLLNKPIFHPKVLGDGKICFVFDVSSTLKKRLQKLYGNFFIFI